MHASRVCSRDASIRRRTLEADVGGDTAWRRASSVSRRFGRVRHLHLVALTATRVRANSRAVRSSLPRVKRPVPARRGLVPVALPAPLTTRQASVGRSSVGPVQGGRYNDPAAQGSEQTPSVPARQPAFWRCRSLNFAFGSKKRPSRVAPTRPCARRRPSLGPRWRRRQNPRHRAAAGIRPRRGWRDTKARPPAPPALRRGQARS